MELKYRKLKKEDYNTWEELAKSQFSEEDFCDKNYLISFGNKVQGWCILNNQNEWIGCCFISTKKTHL